MAIYPSELSHLSLDMRRMIRAQCGKDWRRVTVDARNGSVVVHNSPRPDGLRLAPTTKRAAPARRTTPAPAPLSAPAEQTIVVPVPPRPVSPRMAPAFRATPPPPSPPRVFQQEPPAPLPQTPVRFSALQEPALRPARQAPDAPVSPQWILLPGQNPDSWTGEQFEQNAWRLQARISKGVGPDMALKFFDEVTALHGVDLDMVESVVRQADKVTVDGSTATRKYPVLHFQRGDVLVVVGFRQDTPLIMAAYFSGPGMSGIPTGHGNRGAGGGGARKATGLPTSVNAVVTRLRSCGAEVKEDPGGNTAEVWFAQQSLGKIQTGIRATKDTCRSDYQRCIRKIDSIQQKERSTAR